MSTPGSAIQIEQRMPRCDRCGKMINLRGSHIEAVARDRRRVLFCSVLCQDEFADLTGLAGTDVPTGENETEPGRAQ